MLKADAAQLSGTQTARNDTAAEGACQGQVARPTVTAGRRLAARLVWPAVGCVAALAGWLVACPSVNGHRVWPLRTVATAASVAAPDALRRGNLLDIEGRLLRPGQGRLPVVFVNGRRAALDTRLGPFDRATVIPGADAIEPRREVALAEASGRALRIVRYVEGTISGKRINVEDVTVAAVGAGPRVALTFDDGPHPRWTPRVLDLLAKYRVHATFFVLGPQARRYRRLLEREIAEGHEIGCHSWAHPWYARISPAARAADLRRWEAAVVPVLGHRPVWFRPPYGSINAAVRAELAKRGYRVAMWTVDTWDWRKPAPSVIAARILRGARRDGAVILMHDGGGDRSRTVAALAIALPKLLARGVQLLTLSQLKGLEPAPPPGLVIVTAGGVMRVKRVDVEVYADGRAIEPAPAAGVCDGRLLVAVRPVCEALGAPVAWDGELRALTVRGPRGEAVLRVNSTRVSLGGRDVKISVPVVNAGGATLAPVHLIARLTGTRAEVAPDLKRVEFVSGQQRADSEGGQSATAGD